MEARSAVDDLPLPDYTLVGQGARVELMGAIRRLRAELDAKEQLVLAAIAADPDPYRDGFGDLGKNWVREEVACALRIPPATAAATLHTATELVTRRRETLAAMRDGAFGLRHAQRLVDATVALPDDAAAEVEAAVLPRAGAQTVAQFAACVRRAALAADPRGAEQRHTDGRADRRVVFRPVEDGMSELWAYLPAEDAARLEAAVQRLADSWKGLDERTADQRRVDALVALVGGYLGTGTGMKPAVNVTVALSTLLGMDQQPGELDGHGPIPPVLARAIAFDPTATWRRLVTDEHGSLVDVSSATYRPPAPMARYVQLRDGTCRFPGCQRHAARCDLDHTRPWCDHGPTCPANLMALCPRHHHLKHDTDWRLKRRPDGTTHWQSPTGNSYHRPSERLPHDTTMTTEQDREEAPPF